MGNQKIDLRDKMAALELFYQGRFYHSTNHIRSMLKDLESYTLSGKEREILEWAIIFHDAVYDPRQNDNEEMSCEEFRKYYPEYEHLEKVCQLIMATKEHKLSRDKLSNIIVQLDFGIFGKGIAELIKYERGIFKEYQFVPIQDYLSKRLTFLGHMMRKLFKNGEDIDQLIKYVASRKYKIGIYPGSFNPFHIGHMNIVKKAEDLFDKVIIARGINPEKGEPAAALPKLPNEIVEYKGLVTDLFKPINENVELYFVRGLRSVYDIGYEESLRKTVQDIKPDIKFVYFFCDNGMEHVSSSQIRGLMKFDQAAAEKYMVK